jgi:hypothetical protein
LIQLHEYSIARGLQGIELRCQAWKHPFSSDTKRRDQDLDAQKPLLLINTSTEPTRKNLISMISFHHRPGQLQNNCIYHRIYPVLFTNFFVIPYVNIFWLTVTNRVQKPTCYLSLLAPTGNMGPHFRGLWVSPARIVSWKLKGRKQLPIANLMLGPCIWKISSLTSNPLANTNGLNKLLLSWAS